jgi:hypothetical protein
MSSGMLILTLCRFDVNGVLTRSDVDVKAIKYIAISHIWANATWHSSIANIGWEVKASSQKAAFLAEQFPQLVGSDYFWMDVLCIDQRSAEAKTNIIRHIPFIYRNAQRTIVVRENGGLESCCADAVAGCSWVGDNAAASEQRLADHVIEAHDLVEMVEVWFTRLWPLQEMILSDNLQFTICGKETQSHGSRNRFDPFRDRTSFKQLLSDMMYAAQSWAHLAENGLELQSEINNFINAFLDNGFVSRKPRKTSRNAKRPLSYGELVLHINSMRVTSNPRDFIFAILPQYGWYMPPDSARSLTFGQLFVDAFYQAQRSGFGFPARFTKGMKELSHSLDESFLPTEDIPIPEHLGDFVQLLNLPSSENPEANLVVILLTDVKFPDTREMSSVLDLIESSMQLCRHCWYLAHRGVLSKHGMWPEDQPWGSGYHSAVQEFEAEIIELKSRKDANIDRLDSLIKLKNQYWEIYQKSKQTSLDPSYYEVECLKVLNLMWVGLFEQDSQAASEWHSFRETLIELDPPFYKETMLRLAALISCRSGISALSWSRDKLEPVLVEWRGSKMLGLQSSAIHHGSSRPMPHFALQRGNGYVLLSPAEDGAGFYLGALPNEVLGESSPSRL